MVVNEFVAIISKGRSIAGIGVGVGGGVCVLKLTLLPLSLLPELGVGDADCCVVSGVAVGVAIAAGGFVCRLLLLAGTSFIETFPVKKTYIVIMEAISPISTITPLTIFLMQ